jgi:hypothetical protein
MRVAMKRNTPNFTSGQFSLLRRGAISQLQRAVETQTASAACRSTASQRRLPCFTLCICPNILTEVTRIFLAVSRDKVSGELALTAGWRPFVNSGDIEGVLAGAMSLEEAMEATETEAQRVCGKI